MSMSLLAFCGACFAAAMSGGLFRPGAWFRDLKKPSWQPPDWLFAPAWMVLYGTIAVSGWLVYEAAGWQGAKLPLILYAAHLVFNALWSALFFGMKRMDLAMIDVVIMWLTIVAMIVLFWPISTLAALLLLPYLAWTTFAGALNYTVMKLNPGNQPAAATQG